MTKPFISVGYDPGSGSILRVGGVRVLGLRAPVTLVSTGEDPNAPPNERPPNPRPPPSAGPTSEAAPSRSSEWTRPSTREHPRSPPPASPPIHAEAAPTTAPQNEPPNNMMFHGWW